MRPYRSLLAAFAKEKCFQISDKKNTVGDKCHNLSFYLSDNCVVICGGRLERIMLDRCNTATSYCAGLGDCRPVPAIIPFVVPPTARPGRCRLTVRTTSSTHLSFLALLTRVNLQGLCSRSTLVLLRTRDAASISELLSSSPYIVRCRRVTDASGGTAMSESTAVLGRTQKNSARPTRKAPPRPRQAFEFAIS